MSEEKKLDRRQRRSREAIRTAFSELLMEKPYEQITVTEIARRADRDRKTFYLHYGSIEDLVDEMIEELVQHDVKEIEERCVDEDGNFDVGLFYTTLSEMLAANFAMRSNILRHIEPSWLISRMRPVLTKTLVESDALGLAEALGPYLEVFVPYFCSGLLTLYSQWLTLDSELPIETLSELAIAATAGGVTALAGAADRLGVNKPEA